jgi:hypothetical protein
MQVDVTHCKRKSADPSITSDFLLFNMCDSVCLCANCFGCVKLFANARCFVQVAFTRTSRSAQGLLPLACTRIKFDCCVTWEPWTPLLLTAVNPKERRESNLIWRPLSGSPRRSGKSCCKPLLTRCVYHSLMPTEYLNNVLHCATRFHKCVIACALQGN